MKFLATITLLLLASALLAQTFLEQRQDGLWLVFTNSPPRWQLSWSTNLTSWTPYLRKESLAPLKRIEVRLGTEDDAQFWKLEPLP